MAGSRVKTILLVPYVIFSFTFLGLLSCSTPPPSSVPIAESSSVQVQQQIPLSLPHSLGILPFDFHSDGSQWSWLRQGLPDMLVTDLAMQTGIHIISRQSLGEVLREQWLQHRGMTEPGLAVKLGQLSGTRYLLKGNVYHIDEQLSVDVHLLDVERGVVVRAGRVTGTPENFLALERQLSQHVKSFFDVQSELDSRKSISHDERSAIQSFSDVVVKEDPQSIPQSDLLTENPRSPLLTMDVQLSLDRAQRLREEAWLFANEVWRRGLVIELGVPGDRVDVVAERHQGFRYESLLIPVSSFFLPGKLRDIHRALELSRLTENSQEAVRGMLVWKADESTTRLFAERFRSPRRLFVRAISQSGEVLAVSSPWTWRVDQTVEVEESGAIQIRLSPEPTIQGNAEFLKFILSQHLLMQHFDAVVVPVPKEHRMVSVEPFESGNENDLNDSEFGNLPVTLQQRLKDWLLENWRPPVTESLPVRGYLPGNRRAIQLRVWGQHGVVEDVQLSQVPHEELLQADVKRLVSQLIGYCLSDCRNTSSEYVEANDAFAFRVQLDLIKDLQHVGFGDISP
ncbi:CsgG/HfaB family protein [Candidatus Nitrospira salsa]|nr:MAG: hypothetical protein NPIRA01_06860 [Nitrospirales bacterium]